jgi:predicted transcriptional regulator
MSGMEMVKRIPIPQVLETAKALSSELRLRILEALSEKPMSLSELVKLLGVAQPTISINIQMLEEAGLVITTQGLGRGKICSRACDSLLLDLPRVAGEHTMTKEIQMPVGLYTDFLVKGQCGLVGKEGLIGNADDPLSFYLPERSEALLIWFSEDGYVEYRFPNITLADHTIRSLTVSAELCSEAWGYNEEWPSDITVSVNGAEIGTWTCPGDFGDTKGRLTPGWWYGVTQHGKLTEWTIGPDGSLINGEPCSSTSIQDLQLDKLQAITVRFAVKPDAANRGGINLFGKQFGNDAQDIKLIFVR